MKRLLSFAGVLLWSACAIAGNTKGQGCDIGSCSISLSAQAVPMDSLRGKVEIKKMELKSSEGVQPARLEIKETEQTKTLHKPIERNLKIDKAEPLQERILPVNGESRAMVEEMKEAAKRDSKAKKPAPEPARPAVSYPYFTGGNVAVREFVRSNQRYPEECKHNRARGRVEVTITIAPDGTPHSATITKSSGNEYMDAEAMRVAGLMPKWNPAVESDEPQEIKHTIFVNFRPGR